jgi:ribulose-phosphate 3-epimerase
MPTVVPAILEETKEGLSARLFEVERITGVERIQIDFADGVFVSHRTVSIGQFEPLNPAFHWEAHVMAKPPLNLLDYEIAGFKTLVVHYEAFADPVELGRFLDEIRSAGLIPGLALNPETPVSVVPPLREWISQVTILSVHPGFQGQTFLPESIDRVRQLKQAVPDVILEVDGGVNEHNAPDLVAAGANLVAVGSALFETQDPNETYRRIGQALINRS